MNNKVPYQHELVWPVLQYLSKEKTSTFIGIRDHLLETGFLKEPMLSERVPSGGYLVNVRLNSCIIDMKWAKYIEQIGVREYRILEKGLTKSSENLEEITRRQLAADPDFLRAKKESEARSKERKRRKEEGAPIDDMENPASTALFGEPQTESEAGTPEKLAPKFDRSIALKDASWAELKKEMKYKVILEVKRIIPREFELLSLDLMRREFKITGLKINAEHTGGTNDKGIDGIVSYEGTTEGGRAVIQAKRYSDKPVGLGLVQRLGGILIPIVGSKIGIYITSSRFTAEAYKYTEDCKLNGYNLVLVDGEKLAELIIKHDIDINSYVDGDFNDNGLFNSLTGEL